MKNTRQNQQSFNLEGEEEVTNEIFTIPNLITFIRLCFIPVFLFLLISGNNALACLVFALCAATDFIDGMVARATNQVSKLGQLLDPFVDRALVISAVIGLLVVGRVPAWIVVLVLARDMFLLAGGYYLLKNWEIRVPVIYPGKFAATLMYVGFAAMLLNAPQVAGLGVTGAQWLPGFNGNDVCWGIWIVYAGLLLNIFTTAFYIYDGYRRLQEKKFLMQRGRAGSTEVRNRNMAANMPVARNVAHSQPRANRNSANRNTSSADAAHRNTSQNRAANARTTQSNAAQSRAANNSASKNRAANRNAMRNSSGAHVRKQSKSSTLDFSPAAKVFGAPGSFAKHGSSWGAQGSLKLARIIPLIIVAIILLFIIINIVRVINYPNIYSGVRIGDVDVSGMTQEQAATAVSEYYSPRIETVRVRVFAGEDGKENYYSGQGNNEEIAEQLSAEDADANVNYWEVDKNTLGVYINSESVAQAAFDVGRDGGGLFARLGAQFFGENISVQLNFDDTSLNKFMTSINKTMGYERHDWDIEVKDGSAHVLEGYDGEEVNENTLKSQLTQAFTQEGTEYEFVANVEVAAVRIDAAQAQNVANSVNSAISSGALVTYAGTTKTYTAAQLGDWVQTKKESAEDAQDDGRAKATQSNWKLAPYISPEKFSTTFYADFQATSNITDTQVTFDVQGNNVTVNTNGEGQVPRITDAISALNAEMFESSQNSGSSANAAGGDSDTSAQQNSQGTQPNINIEAGDVPEQLTLEEALEIRLVTQVSTYTTTYSNSSGTEARNTNIRIGAGELNNTVCSANGSWSFNGIVGDTTEDKGYLAAGSIAEGEYVDTFGGGICQVATTVFNALYESPYKITERHPHSLYISSYPAGRDAAIAWSDLDLTWKNETKSDVIMRTSTDDTSVTVSLYSTPQTFSVESELGDWEEGSKYKTVVKEDETLAKGTSYVKTTGTDGSKISVTRTVYDANKQILYTNFFESEYEPKNKVIVCGPGTEVDTSRN